MGNDQGTSTRGRPGWARSAGSFSAATDGVSTVEFALISVPFLGLLCAIFQVSLSFLMQQGLRVAVEGAARQVMLGTAQGQGSVSSAQQFRDTYLCPGTGSLLPSFVSCASVAMDVRSYPSFSTLTANQVNKSFLTDGSGTQYVPGGPCDIVVVRAIYPMPNYMPFLTDPSLGRTVTASSAGLTSYNGAMVQILTAAAVFRNEPYAAGAKTNSSGGCSS